MAVINDAANKSAAKWKRWRACYVVSPSGRGDRRACCKCWDGQMCTQGEMCACVYAGEFAVRIHVPHWSIAFAYEISQYDSTSAVLQQQWLALKWQWLNRVVRCACLSAMGAFRFLFKWTSTERNASVHRIWDIQHSMHGVCVYAQALSNLRFRNAPRSLFHSCFLVFSLYRLFCMLFSHLAEDV